MDKNGKKEMAVGAAASFDSFMGRIRRFIKDTSAEMGRCTWPTKSELLESTLLVVVAIVLLGAFVAGVDKIAVMLIRLITVGKF